MKLWVAGALGLGILGLTGCVLAALPVVNDPLFPIYMVHTGQGFEVVSPCGSPMKLVSVIQSPDTKTPGTFRWEAKATGAGVTRAAVMVDKLDGYRVTSKGDFDSSAESVVAFDPGKGRVPGFMTVTFDDVAVGQAVYQNGVMSEAEMVKFAPTAFQC